MYVLLRLLLTALYTIYHINKVFVVYKVERKNLECFIIMKVCIKLDFV